MRRTHIEPPMIRYHERYEHHPPRRAEIASIVGHSLKSGTLVETRAEQEEEHVDEEVENIEEVEEEDGEEEDEEIKQWDDEP